MSHFNGDAWQDLLFGASAGGLSHCWGIGQSACKNWGTSPCSCPPEKSFTVQQVPQAPLASSLSVTGLGRKDRRSPQPCLFKPSLFPQRWAHVLTLVTFRVQETLLQLLVCRIPHESKPAIYLLSELASTQNEGPIASGTVLYLWQKMVPAPMFYRAEGAVDLLPVRWSSLIV